MGGTSFWVSAYTETPQDAITLHLSDSTYRGEGERCRVGPGFLAVLISVTTE